eukprot:TRINITY_DN49441_c0_g1_i1.p2 TRINITY_DN49441_c0_g1~~TRINITY_DN49441_c0_g1_i1.p2  ORF type:complete len:119 (+),score=40.57 TRINITY_DN49441_c0_g1_i1:162-518(+)
MSMHKFSDKEKLRYLSESDATEVALRQLSSYIHQQRTGDHVAAMGTLAIQPSGSKVDIAPAWLVEEGAGISQQEYKRRLRAKASGGAGDSSKGGKGGNGKGKKGDKKGEKKKAPKKES